MQTRFSVLLLALGLAGTGSAATFGTVVPISGNAADIALDETRGHVYVANFGAYRVEVVSIASRSLLTPIPIPAPPSAVAVSPDAHYLVVGEYEKPIGTPLGGFQKGTGGLDIVDLTGGNATQHQDLPCPVVTVSFGSDGQALVVCSNASANIYILNPVAGSLQTIGTVPVQSMDLPLNPTGPSPALLSAAPSQIIQASAGVSGDLNTIVVLAGTTTDPTATSKYSVLIRYNVPAQALSSAQYLDTPPPGPRSVSVDQTGTNFVVDWGLLRLIPQPLTACAALDANDITCLWAQFPNVTGAFNLGSHAWDRLRNVIYANIPTSTEKAVLHVAASDNLTILERIQLQENLVGKSLMSSDMNTMYSASQSGLTILPVGQLSTATPQVAAAQEDLFFQADACSAGLLTQTLTITNPYSPAAADFTLALPAGTQGITFSATTGTTPAQVQITVDPSMYQSAKGTTTVLLSIASKSAVNLPATVRVLINTADVNQRGQILNVPGKIVDMLGDPARGRLYILRQDTNMVLVMDTNTRQILAAPLMRTGNTPVHMAMTTDLHYLIVGNDNSQIASVLDLNLLQPANPVLFPFGHYPRSIGIANGAMFATTRNAGTPNPCSAAVPAAFLDHITFTPTTYSVADTPCTLSGMTNPSIYANNLPTADGVIAASPDNNYLMLALASGDIAEYDVTAQTWAAARQDFTGLGGAYGSFTGFLSPDTGLPLTSIDYAIGPNLFDLALVPLGSPFPDATATSSGVAIDLGLGLRTTYAAATAPGVIQRFDPSNQSESGATPMAEAPLTNAAMTYTPIGLIGESLLSFTRTLAVSADQGTIYASTISGITVLQSNFDQPAPPPVVTSVVSAADGVSAAATGGSVFINGTGLAVNSAGAGGYPLPTLLGGACVMVGNTTIPLFAAAPNQLKAEIPFTVSGSATLVVRAAGGISSPFAFTVQSEAPAIFHTGSNGFESGLPAVYRVDNGALLSYTNPIHPNVSITIYLTGLGTVTPLPALGAAAPSKPVTTVDSPPTVTIGGYNLAVTSAVLVSGMATVYQLTAKVPQGIHPGNSEPLTISGGSSSTTLQVRVVSP